VETPSGIVKLTAIVDSGAEINLINQVLYKQYGIQPVLDLDLLRAKFLDDNKLTLYVAYRARVTTSDASDVILGIEQVLYGAVFVGYNLVLGYPWLEAANPLVN